MATESKASVTASVSTFFSPDAYPDGKIYYLHYYSEWYDFVGALTEKDKSRMYAENKTDIESKSVNFGVAMVSDELAEEFGPTHMFLRAYFHFMSHYKDEQYRRMVAKFLDSHSEWAVAIRVFNKFHPKPTATVATVEMDVDRPNPELKSLAVMPVVHEGDYVTVYQEDDESIVHKVLAVSPNGRRFAALPVCPWRHLYYATQFTWNRSHGVFQFGYEKPLSSFKPYVQAPDLRPMDKLPRAQRGKYNPKPSSQTYVG